MNRLLCCLTIAAIAMTTSTAMADLLVPNTAYDLYVPGYTSLGTNNAAAIKYDFKNDVAADAYTATYGYSSDAVGTYGTAGREFFYSFCVEKSKSIGKGNYLGTLNETGAYTTTQDTVDYISVGTAWLYYQYATGQLSGYDYTNAYGQLKSDITALQHAIWYLESEIDATKLAAGGTEFYDLAVAQYDATSVTDNYTLAQDFYDNDAKYTIYTINIENTDGTGDKQDALFMTKSAVPEPTTFLIWGIGICLAAFGFRRFKK